VPKPPIITVAPSRTSASASAVEATILLIMVLCSGGERKALVAACFVF